MSWFERDGVRIHYTDTGGDGPPVVLSHGFLMDHTMFEPQVQHLRDRYRCIAWDERGHGETGAPGPFTYWDSAHDLLALLDHLDVGSAVLAGMSQGGFLSLRAALLQPERVQGLVLIDTQAGPENPDAKPMYDALFDDWVTNGPSEQTAQIVASVILGEGYDASAWMERWIARDPASVREPYAALVGREDIHDRLAEITCPAVVIHGSADAAISVDRAQRLCEGLPGCTGLEVIEGAGHASNLTHPDAVNAVVDRFLASVTAGTR